MELKLDLHIHSELSLDGRMTLEEIVSAAKEKGLDGVAVCDHDKLFSLPPRTDDFLVISGTEFSTEYGHLLGLFLSRPIKAKTFDGIVKAIHRQGGLAVLAHPFERSEDTQRLLPTLPELDGVEVWNGRANRKRKTANAEAEAFAAAHGLPRFAGSDAHVAREIGNGFVTVTVEAPTEEQIKAALLLPGNPVTGVDGKHVDCAKSQRTRLKKDNAGLGKRIKWFGFAVKCWMEDVRK